MFSFLFVQLFWDWIVRTADSVIIHQDRELRRSQTRIIIILTHLADHLDNIGFKLSWLYGAANPKRLGIVPSVTKHTMSHRIRTFDISKDIEIVSLVQKLQQFFWMGEFFILVELNQLGYAINGATQSSLYVGSPLPCTALQSGNLDLWYKYSLYDILW